MLMNADQSFQVLIAPAALSQWVEFKNWINEQIIQTCFVNSINWFIRDPIQKNDSLMNYLLSWNCQGEPKQIAEDFQWVA